MGNVDKFSKKIADDIVLTKFSVYKTHAANKMISAVPELKTGESSTLFQKVGVKERQQLISISADFRSLIKELFSSLDNSFKMVMARSIEASQENINRARINFGKYLERTLNDSIQEIFADVIQDQIIDKYEKKYRTVKHGKDIDLMLKSLNDTASFMTQNIKKYLKIKVNLQESEANSFRQNGASYTVSDLYSIDIEFHLFDMNLEINTEKQNGVLYLYERKAGEARFPMSSYYDRRYSKVKLRHKRTEKVYHLSALEETRKTWKGTRGKYSLLSIIDLGTKGGYTIKPYGKPTFGKAVKEPVKSKRFGAKEFKSAGTGRVSIKETSKKKYLINNAIGKGVKGYLFQKRVNRTSGIKGKGIVFEAYNVINKKIELEFVKRVGEFMKEQYGQIKDDMLEWLTNTKALKKVEIKQRSSKKQRINALKGIATRIKG